MCGFAGFLGGEIAKDSSLSENTLEAMGKKIITRGPDSSGLWFDVNNSIGLCHRRLSIIDLSSSGHQPMISKSDRYIISYNGEIYNHLDLRRELEKEKGFIKWTGSSDTETVLACIDHWGLDKSLNNFIGMFSFSLWDCKKKNLTLVRDRLGEKPLYYGWHGNGGKKVFIFGSDLKSFRAYPEFNGIVDRNSLCLFLKYNCIPSPHCIYVGFNKLDPGCYLNIALGQSIPEITRYWDANALVQRGMDAPIEDDFNTISKNIESKIQKSVNQQSVSDVPLGTFLSGGIDSTVITSILQSQATNPVKTFTIGFEETEYNEAIYAKKISKELGTDHTELYVTSQDSLNLIPNLSNIYGEPFADSSQIPTFLLCELAKKSVTVALSGDGGDEMFCGYNRYNFANDLWYQLRFVPLSVKKQFSKLLMAVPSMIWDKASVINGPSRLSQKIQKVSDVLMADTINTLYFDLISDIKRPSDLVIGGTEGNYDLDNMNARLDKFGSKRSMMLKDTLFYLPDDILTKVDRASMGVSLEVRVPFLSHELVEETFKIPISMHLYKGKSKAILKNILKQYISKDLIERPKMGFGVPLDSWLRGPLRDWAENLLDERRLNHEGFFITEKVQKIWNEHKYGSKNWSSQLWNILMFQSWLENQK
jgi:asparagine synthase (glutamine-hydrolysing)